MDQVTSLPFVHEQHPAPTPPDKRAEILRDPGFGRVFTDHMVIIQYTEGKGWEGKGWHDAKVTARAPIAGSMAIGARAVTLASCQPLPSQPLPSVYWMMTIGSVNARPKPGSRRISARLSGGVGAGCCSWTNGRDVTWSMGHSRGCSGRSYRPRARAQWGKGRGGPQGPLREPPGVRP